MAAGSLLPAIVRDELRRSFWFLPAIGMLIGGLAALAAVGLDDTLRWEGGLVQTNDSASARGLLETIATVTVSVAGITFSVTVVALQLASQQLSPRILRSFQTDRLAQSTLAFLLGLFVYTLVVLAQLDVEQATTGLFSVTLAVVFSVVAFGLFAAFIHDVVISLQASTLIRRTAAEARDLIKEPYPSGVGRDPDDGEHAVREIEQGLATGERVGCTSSRAGYITGIDGERVLSSARERDGVVRQLAQIGDFVVTEQVLAEVSASSGAAELADAVSEAFAISTERTPVQDVAFPIRQLADVALKGLSPSVNDPTTAENAMGSLADALVVFAIHDPVPRARADEDGRPRLLARAPNLDDLVHLGFEQVRVAAEAQPTFLGRLVQLLDEVDRAAEANGREREEIRRQRKLIEGEALREDVRDGDG